jgi:carbonic anhydrase
MSVIDDAVRANRSYAKRHDPRLAQRPASKIAVGTCMDPRLSNLPELLGLSHADIDVIRTGGPAVTDDVLGELIVSTRIIGAREVRSHPWIGREIPVRGFVLDMETGLISEVEAESRQPSG